MVIDLILDRKDDLASGIDRYNARDFYNDVNEYNYDNDNPLLLNISRAMDCGTEEDVKNALCDYVLRADYNPAICDFVNSVEWLKDCD